MRAVVRSCLLGSALCGCHAVSVKLGDGETGMTDGDSADTDTADTDTADTGTTDTDTADTDTTDTDTADTGTADTGTPTPMDCVPYGVLVNASFDLETSGSIDSFDGAEGPWSGTTAREAATVVVNGTAACVGNVNASTVHGDVWTGAGSDPAASVCLSWGGSITGVTAALAAAVPLPNAVLPSGLPASAGALTLDWSATETLSGSHTVDSLSLSTSAELDVPVDTTLYVEGDVIIDGASLFVASGAHLDLYVGGDLTVEWSGALRADDGAPAVTIHMVRGGRVSLSTSGSVEGVLVAPASGVLIESGSWQGAVSADNLTVTWSGQVHTDERVVCAR